MFPDVFTDLSQSTSAHRFLSTPPPMSHPTYYPTDTEPRPRHGRPKKQTRTPTPRASRQTAPQSLRLNRDNLPEPREVDVIECCWTGCNYRIQHDVRSVKDHVKLYHGDLSRTKELLTCRWVRRDTGQECGSRLLPKSLCRHTLDLHTNLIMEDCVCGKRFRRDTLGRHRCEVQGNW